MKPSYILTSIFFFLLPLFDFGQNVITIDTLANGNIHIVTNGYECVIFSINNDSYHVGPSETKWMPTVEEVISCDNIIQNYINKKERKKAIVLGNSPVIHENYNKYVRQYMGYVNKRGKKILAVKFIWKDEVEKHEEFQWLNQRVDVIGGGTYFWQIEVNLRCKKCFNFNSD